MTRPLLKAAEERLTMKCSVGGLMLSLWCCAGCSTGMHAAPAESVQDAGRVGEADAAPPRAGEPAPPTEAGAREASGASGATAGMGAEAGTSATAGTAAEAGTRAEAGTGAQAGTAATPPVTAASIDCSREGLRALVAHYFEALAAHDPARLDTAQDIRFTENAQVRALGEGLLWKSAGRVSFQRSVLDSERCSTFTQAVVDNQLPDMMQFSGPTIVGVRLRLVEQRLKDIELRRATQRGDGFGGRTMSRSPASRC